MAKNNLAAGIEPCSLEKKGLIFSLTYVCDIAINLDINDLTVKNDFLQQNTKFS